MPRLEVSPQVSVQLLKELGADHDEITTRLQARAVQPVSSWATNGPNGQVLTKVLIIQDNYKEAFNQIEMAKDPWKNMGND